MAERHVFECDGLHTASYDQAPMVDVEEHIPHVSKQSCPPGWIRVWMPIYMRELARADDGAWTLLPAKEASPLTAGKDGYCEMIFHNVTCAGGFMYEAASKLRKARAAFEKHHESNDDVDALVEDALNPLATVNDE